MVSGVWKIQTQQRPLVDANLPFCWVWFRLVNRFAPKDPKSLRQSHADALLNPPPTLPDHSLPFLFEGDPPRFWQPRDHVLGAKPAIRFAFRRWLPVAPGVPPGSGDVAEVAWWFEGLEVRRCFWDLNTSETANAYQAHDKTRLGQPRLISLMLEVSRLIPTSARICFLCTFDVPRSQSQGHPLLRKPVASG